jgi:hypothetical protein
VLTSQGEPVAGRTVVFRLDDEPPLEAVTGDDGRAAVTTTYRGSADQRTVTYSFAGDDTHSRARAARASAAADSPAATADPTRSRRCMIHRSLPGVSPKAPG